MDEIEQLLNTGINCAVEVIMLLPRVFGSHLQARGFVALSIDGVFLRLKPCLCIPI